MDKARKWVQEGQRIVFFGGAGVSTASGIPDFRSATGLYNRKNQSNYSPEYMLSHEFSEDHPKEFQDYVKNELIFEEAKPNGAHFALTELEKRGQLSCVITQNIDSLHQKAGTKNVIEIHGNLRDYYCKECHKSFTIDYFMDHENPVHCDSCNGIIRPDVVLYGEALDQGKMSQGISQIASADVFIIGGTSLMVYPAAGLINYYRGEKMILINQDPTPLDHQANIAIYEDISKVLEQLVN
ncbi:MAG: NAD-dependent protein deacylase [Tissierellia bacterium]|nr:NAD-dependent protein deacylase [Tissierellia bacterium]